MSTQSSSSQLDVTSDLASSSSKDKSRKRAKYGDEDSGGRISIESNDDDAAERKKASSSERELGSSSSETIQDANKIVEMMTDERKKVDQQRQSSQVGSLSDHCAKILKQLRTFNFSAYRGFEVTNCSFVKSSVEICYILKDARSIDKETLTESLALHLGIQADDLKLMELRSRPEYKETCIQPGDSVSLYRQISQSFIGAFVEVPGKGIHALMCGHGKTPGDTFCHPNGNNHLGRVEVSLTPLSNISTNEDTIFGDISLGRLYDQRPPNSTVTTGDGTALRLEEDPKDAHSGTAVRLFTNGDRQGTIKQVPYFKMDSHLNIKHRLISVQNSEDQPVHAEGESGILIVSEPSGIQANGAFASVTAYGMLIALETKQYADGRTEVVSLAAPLKSGFDALKSDSYCNGEVKFC